MRTALSASAASPTSGVARNRLAAAPMRWIGSPPMAAHDGRRAHARRHALRMPRAESRYQGSLPSIGYEESSTRLRIRSGWRTAKVCEKKVPYESPYKSILPMPSASRTAIMSSTALPVP